MNPYTELDIDFLLQRESMYGKHESLLAVAVSLVSANLATAAVGSLALGAALVGR